MRARRSRGGPRAPLSKPSTCIADLTQRDPGGPEPEPRGRAAGVRRGRVCPRGQGGAELRVAAEAEEEAEQEAAAGEGGRDAA